MVCNIQFDEKYSILKEIISVIMNVFVLLFAINMVPKIKEIAFNKSPSNCQRNNDSIVSNSEENKT
jgi:hypothetical protein